MSGRNPFGILIRGAIGTSIGIAATSSKSGKTVAVIAFALCALPAVKSLIRAGVGRLFGPSSSSSRLQARVRRLQFVAHMGDPLLNDSEVAILHLLHHPNLAGEDSRTERVRLLSMLLRCVQQVEQRRPEARDTRLFIALIHHEINLLVDSMSYDELYEAFGEEDPRVQGMTGDAIAALPTCAIHKETHNSCAICLEKYEINDIVCTLPKCDHVFHRLCCEQWLSKKAICPVCRTDVGDGY